MPKVTKNLKKKCQAPICCICLDTTTEKVRITSCRHKFHYKCIKKWSERENRCPLCKRRFNYIIRNKTLKESVRKRNQTDETTSIYSTILRQFFSDGHFRNVLTQGIIENSRIAVMLFKFIFSACFMLRQEQIIPPFQQNDVRQAYSWVDRTIIDQPNLHHLLPSPTT